MSVSAKPNPNEISQSLAEEPRPVASVTRGDSMLFGKERSIKSKRVLIALIGLAGANLLGLYSTESSREVLRW